MATRRSPNPPAPVPVPNPAEPLQRVRDWFEMRGWEPFAFQEQTWKAYLDGQSGLLNVATGAGKTYAAWMGPLAEYMAEPPSPEPKLRVLFITPLRAMTRDIERALQRPVEDLGLSMRVESRTGDTTQHQRTKQARAMPDALVTTPESAALLLARDNARELFSDLRAVIVDEWHELLSTKRGVQVELMLSRLRGMAPRMRTWALSATIANLDEAMACAMGGSGTGVLVRDPTPRVLHIETLIPDEVDAFPWAGHLGMPMLERLLQSIDIRSSSLLFTNVRSQTERWYQAILQARPEWAPVMALHHGSIDREDRERTEDGLKSGELKLVVCTSSLDLGVDFSAVEQVFQIGSPRGVARLIQRAGRSGHRPGAAGRIVCVPTHALELIELAALRRAVGGGAMEARRPLVAPIDVLSQHLVTCALGGGFTPESLFLEVRSTWSYRALSSDDFSWTLDLMTRGGHTLQRYPEFRKIEPVNGVFRVTSDRIAQLHRMNIGTIVSDSSVEVGYQNGRNLGTIEEVFIASLRPGDRFMFAGKVLELVAQRGLRAVVKPAAGPITNVPRWGGGKLPISDVLSGAVQELLRSPDLDGHTDASLRSAAPVVAAQRDLSGFPEENELLVESCRTREGFHLFVFPFEGRLVHEGIAAIVALRLGRLEPGTFTVSVNDYGFELLSPDPFPWAAHLRPELFSTDELDADTEATVNLAELARYRFREVARVAMLIPQNQPGKKRPARQLLASSSLIYEVFRTYDPGNLLLQQAHREVLERNFEQARLVRTLERLSKSQILHHATRRPTPLAFPLIVERMGARLSTEDLVTRIEKMKRDYTTRVPVADEKPVVVAEPALPSREYALGRLTSG
jgi:ATP-dependent Lhr-like helicase